MYQILCLTPEGFNAALATQQKYQTLLEVAESLTSQLDEDILISYIMKRFGKGCVFVCNIIV
jgi:hypothetical protein